MYGDTRFLHAHLSRIQDAVLIAKKVAALLNEKAGTRFRVGGALGTRPGILAVTSAIETTEQLEHIRQLMWSDPDVGAAMRFADDLFYHGEGEELDVIEMRHVTTGVEKEWTSAFRTRCKPGHRAQAIDLGIHAAGVMSKIIGAPVGFSTAVTGDLLRARFHSDFSSLADVAKANAALQGSADFMKLFHAAESAFDANVMHRTIWQWAKP